VNPPNSLLHTALLVPKCAVCGSAASACQWQGTHQQAEHGQPSTDTTGQIHPTSCAAVRAWPVQMAACNKWITNSCSQPEVQQLVSVCHTKCAQNCCRRQLAGSGFKPCCYSCKSGQSLRPMQPSRSTIETNSWQPWHNCDVLLQDFCAPIACSYIVDNIRNSTTSTPSQTIDNKAAVPSCVAQQHTEMFTPLIRCAGHTTCHVSVSSTCTRPSTNAVMPALLPRTSA
jgi:hypothetical protein